VRNILEFRKEGGGVEDGVILRWRIDVGVLPFARAGLTRSFPLRLSCEFFCRSPFFGNHGPSFGRDDDGFCWFVRGGSGRRIS
jgi:hypothetical protein